MVVYCLIPDTMILFFQVGGADMEMVLIIAMEEMVVVVVAAAVVSWQFLLWLLKFSLLQLVNVHRLLMVC